MKERRNGVMSFLLILFPGGDDKRVLIWKMASALNCSATPLALKSTHELNIFSLVFSCDNSFVYSSGKGDGKESEGGIKLGRVSEREGGEERDERVMFGFNGRFFSSLHLIIYTTV